MVLNTVAIGIRPSGSLLVIYERCPKAIAFLLVPFI